MDSEPYIIGDDGITSQFFMSSPWILPILATTTTAILICFAFFLFFRSGKEDDDFSSVKCKTFLKLAPKKPLPPHLGLSPTNGAHIGTPLAMDLLKAQLSSADFETLNNSSTSNGRSLHWTYMEIPSKNVFELHAHPSVEVVKCIKGSLHEIRAAVVASIAPSQTAGPNLRDVNTNWEKKTLNAGEWLVNEPGSIHKSYTADESCTLLVLWCGCHCNIKQSHYPKNQNVNLFITKYSLPQ